ncbi:MAG: hypothetical protein LBM04_02760 [Opitutaceae bacterium]|nr:hypothetical protein [Opitutaceae bacterium]
MNTIRTFLTMFAAGGAALLAVAGCAGKNYDTRPGEPVPVAAQSAPAQNTTPPRAADAPAGNQRLYGGAYALPQQQHAGEIINNFRPVYEQLGRPSLAFYINRDLKNPAKPSVKTRPAPSGKGVVVTTDSLADKQTIRDIERIAAKPFLQAGATLVDQQAASMIASGTAQPGATTNVEVIAAGGVVMIASGTAQSDAAPSAPAGDVAIETLVTSRQVVLPSISAENETITIPDIQMTAIRLSDAAILGQATASDIVNQLPPSALPGLTVQDALEATALNLMADMTARTK